MKNPKTKPSVAPSSTAVRGKYFNQLQQGTNLVILDPALMPYFPDSDSVNRALHAFLAIGDSIQAAAPHRRRPKPASSRSKAAFDPRKGSVSSAVASGD
jgi:hypothetical protein